MGKLIGEFRTKYTGSTYSRSSDGRLLTSANFEGTADGFGTVIGTINFSQTLEESRQTSAPCTFDGQIFGDDGSVSGTMAEGTCEQVSGKNVWKFIFDGQTPDGGQVRTEGIADLAARSYNGQIFEA